MAAPTGRESDKFMLRLPDGMRDRIKSAAEANNRSMNAEIVATLEEKYPQPVVDFAFRLAMERVDKAIMAAKAEGRDDLLPHLYKMREAYDFLQAQPHD